MAIDWKAYKPVLLPDIKNLRDISVYEKHGGYQSLKKVLTETDTWSREKTLETVKEANIRGRGGAGFNAGLKWSFMPKPDGNPRYLVCNGDESEPGTFKDRSIFEYNPHLFIEGAIIAAHVIQANVIYVYIRGEYRSWLKIIEEAIHQARGKGYLGKNILNAGVDIEMHTHMGAGAYICGEETSLLESLEGKRGYPRLKPPFPAQAGLWGHPTTVNNIETLANVPLVIKNGAKWFKSIGAHNHPGPLLYGISGHVNKPGIYEYPSGLPILTLVHDIAGGVRGNKRIKAVIPGGSSTPPLRGDRLDGVTMDNDSLLKAGSQTGTAGMVILDEDTDMVDLLWRISSFYHHESCGQCTPCRDGSGWLKKLLKKIKDGEGEIRDIDTLFSICHAMEGRTICALADAVAVPVRVTLDLFRDEFERKCKHTVYAVA